MDDDDGELRNPFPSPPSHYTKYTSHNLALLALYNQRLPEHPNPVQHHVLSDQTDVPEWPLTQLEKPRIDWILEEPDASYEVFGDRWFVKDKIPSLAELGGNQLYPADPSVDRRPALLSILRSLLVTYSSLTSSVLAPPLPMSATEAPEWQRHVEWITVLGQNLMAAANDLRPVQARGNLELMMRRQLDLRRDETKTLHVKCDVLEAKLKDLRSSAQVISKFGSLLDKDADMADLTASPHISALSFATLMSVG
ncbi:MED7 protein-domain-containing protein [Mycena belliarum]|uniref:Mediator of RNA polymerase II transcription subunit 7 n=1 Tax=Mycena belliarum TaxID=1033014 RepID=A0AAD6UHC5_9AGAR|nr:MED7 protein-domain-containing protein [Mycena belliae]